MPDRVPERAGVSREFWLCLVFPRLALEVRGGGDPDGVALAVVDGDGRVVQASEPAEEAGVGAGLPLNAALALCPALVSVERDEVAEAALLARLAGWAGGFTARVCPESPDALLLEVGGSLRLFGGLDRLRRRVAGALEAMGHVVLQGVATTPRAALWLARAGDARPVATLAELPARLGALPPRVTGWPAGVLAALRGIGAERLADCLRLPRGGLSRRLGHGVLDDLDRALGRLPDPRRAWQPADDYAGRIELAAESADPERLCRVMDRLFAELEGFLRGRQRAVRSLSIRFVHLRRPPTGLELGLVRPGLLAGHFSLLFRERLERLALPAPVIELGLSASPEEALTAGMAGLFGDGEPADGEHLRLVERLRARLGQHAVHGLCVQEDHRPEAAWRAAEPGTASAAGRLPGLRPLWLLDAPRVLESRQGRPWLEGALLPEAGPERIETGWWDGGEVERDYWVARGPRGERLWIFRERVGARRWFLHGLFG